MSDRQARRAAAATWAGFVAASFARSTGSFVLTVVASEAGLDDGPGPIALICDDHDSILNVESRAMARRHAPAPEQWCDGCREKADGGA